MQAAEFVAFRLSSSSEDSEISRKKRYAPRSKRGCLTCRRQRRVKCDETKPTCQRCIKAKVSCIYPAAAVRRLSAASSQARSSLTVFKTSHEYKDLQFWLEIGSYNYGRWHDAPFYVRLLPQFSQAHESARYSLLALSACVHQWHVPNGDARQEILARGSRYYRKACAELLKSDDGRASIEAALMSSLALFAYDSFTDNMARRYVHSDAAIALLRLLKQGFSYNKVSGWRSATGKAGAQVVIEAAENYFNEISYSMSGQIPNSAIENADAASPHRTKLYVPIWLQLDTQFVAFPMKQTSTAATTVQAPSTSWTTIKAAPPNIQNCHTHLVLWHCWLFTWLINTPLSAQELRRSRSLCRQWHIWLFRTMQPGTTEMVSMQNRAQILDQLFEVRLIDIAGDNERANVQIQLDQILTLIGNNVKMFNQAVELQSGMFSRHVRGSYPRKYLRGLAKVVEYVFRRADDVRTQDKAYTVFSLTSERKLDKT